MRAGRLRTRVAIEVATESPNADGDPGFVWGPFAVVWADVEALDGRELFTAQQDASLVQHRVTIRALPGVTAAMRVRIGMRILDIAAVMNLEERDRETVLNCLERSVGV